MLSPNKTLFFVASLLLAAAGAVSAQTITAVSGNGQMVRPNFITDPLVVEVRTAQGAPAPGVEIRWQILDAGLGTIVNSITFTDAAGRASTTFVGALVPPTASFLQTTVNASVAINPSINTNFTVTTVNFTGDGSQSLTVDVLLVSPSLEQRPLVGGAGTTGTVPIRVTVFATRGGTPGPVPNVSVRVREQEGSSGTLRCQEGTVFTNAVGEAVCTPVFGGRLGEGQFSVFVGGDTFLIFSDILFRVTVGPLAAFRITNGNNQSVNAGQALPAPLVAVGEDASGNAVVGADVVWELVSPNTGTLSNLTTVTDANGRVSARLTAGSIPGTFQVRLRNPQGTVQATFTFSVSLTLTGITKNSGDNQTAVTNQPFAEPLVVTVNSAQGPVPNIPVLFTITGGATLSASTVTTNAQGVAQVNVTAGPNAGAVVVTASVSNFSVQFNLTVRLPGPLLSQNSFTSAAGGQRGGVSPGALVQITAPGIAPGLQGCVVAAQFVGGFSYQLARVTVTFNNLSAPLYSVCNLGQNQEFAVAQVPTELPAGLANVTVAVGEGNATVTGVPVTVVAPGLFETVMSDNVRRAVALRPDGSYVSLQNPARRGERVKVFVTGLGAAITAAGTRVATNQVAPSTAPATSPFGIVVGLNNEGVPNVNAPVLSSTLIGIYEVTFEVPTSIPSGANIPFVVASLVNDQFVFSQPSALPVQ
jgi:uncharacterized protein (TIGR03437 family)